MGPFVSTGFPDYTVGKESACNTGDPVLILGLGRSPREGKDYPLQYSGLEKSMDCIVHGVAKSQTWFSGFHFHFGSMEASTLVSGKLLWVVSQNTVCPLHTNLQILNFQRYQHAFHQCQVWLTLQLVLHLLLLMILQLCHLPPPIPPQSVTLLASSLDGSPCVPAVGLYYYTFQDTVL